jgi:hypothetical protein
MKLNETEQACLHLASISFESRPDLYISAADVAYHLGNQTVIKTILKAVMSSGLNLQNSQIIQNVQIILRSLIRISYDSMMQTKTSESQTELLAQIYTDCKLVKKVIKDQDQNELDWLFRVTWNSACYISQMESTYVIRAQFFEVILALFKLMTSPSDIHKDCVEKAAFMAIWYRLQLYHQDPDELHLGKVQEAIDTWKDTTKTPDHVFHFEFELLCLKKDWSKVEKLLQAASKRLLDTNIWKKCCDVVMNVSVESKYLIIVLDCTLEALIKSPQVDVAEYIQWARVLIQALLSSVEDKQSCFKYSNQIKVLLGEVVRLVHLANRHYGRCRMDSCTLLEHRC